MIRKIRFYLDDLESNIFTYDDSDDDWIQQRDTDWTDWIFENSRTTWEDVGPELECTNCNWEGYEENLIEYNQPSDVDNTSLEFLKGCPNCKTDKYLQDI